MSQTLKIYLMLSVVINLLFVGFFLGTLSHTIVAPFPSPARDMAQMLSRLPENQRSQFESAMQPVWKEMDESHARLEKDKQKVQAILMAEPFDQNAYLTQAQQLTQLHAQQRVHIAQIIAVLAKKFTPEERAVLADILSRPPPSGPCAGKDMR